MIQIINNSSNDSAHNREKTVIYFNIQEKKFTCLNNWEI